MQVYAKLKQSGIRLASASCIIKLDEFKEEIVALLRNGSSKKFVADRYGTSQVNLYNWLNKNKLDVKQQSVQTLQPEYLRAKIKELLVRQADTCEIKGLWQVVEDIFDILTGS